MYIMYSMLLSAYNIFYLFETEARTIRTFVKVYYLNGTPLLSDLVAYKY